MPTTPELWLSDQIVNATNDDPYSSHGEPVITQLSNGNIVVVWEGKEGRSPYASTYFRIFDPLGNALTDQIKVADEAYRPVVTALDDGGFLITDLWGVYSGLDPWHNWVESFRFDAEGDQVDYTLHEQISHGGYSDDDQRGLASASVSANSVMIVNTDYNGYSEERLYFQIYDPLADTTSIELPIAVSSGQPGSGIEGVSVAALSNGTYAVAYGVAQSSTETDPYVARFNSAGGLLGMTTVSNTTMISNDPSIVGLTGGGFVVTWMLDGSGGTDSGIRFRVYDNSGNAVTGVLNPLTTVSGNQNQPVVLALDDGGFAIIWDDDNLSDIKGQRFDADGDRVGGEFNIDTGGSQTNISATGLADGRFAVTWQEGDDVRMEIYDVRDFVYGVSYDGSGTWHIGTVGDDAITEGAGIDVVRGRAGDDTVFVTSGIGSDSFKGGAGTDTIDWSGALIVGGDAVFDLEAGTASAGGQTEEMIGFENLNGSNNWDTIIGTGGDNILNGNGGDDTIDGGSGEDVIDGGSGNDLVIDSDGPGFGRDVGGGGVDTLSIGESSSFQLYPGLHYDLSAGQASWRDLLSGNLIGGDTFTGFENITLARSAAVTGTAGDNEIIFSPNVLGNNTINGLAGADWIVGGGGADTIDGGSESDVIYGEGGDDILLGGAGADWLDGGSGFDFASYDGSASAVMVDLAAGVGYGGDAQGDRYFGIENVSGSAFDDTLIGDGDDVTLIGGEGNDTLRGGAGSDTLDGGGGIDTLDGMAGDDFYFVENAADIVVAAVGEGSDRVFAGVSFTLGAGVEIEMLTALNPALATALDLTGNEIAQTMIGNAGANWLNGMGGADIMNGLGGDDFYFVDDVGDIIVAATGAGNDRVFTSVDYTLVASAEVEMLTTTNSTLVTSIDLTGNQLAQTIIGDAGANILNGRGGSDIMNGGLGADIFVFDTALGAGNIDTLIYNPADDTIHLDDAIFAGLAAGTLAADAFHTGSAAADALDRIIYDNGTGALLFDADGSGAGAAVQFATISGGWAMTSSEFAVV